MSTVTFNPAYTGITTPPVGGNTPPAPITDETLELTDTEQVDEPSEKDLEIAAKEEERARLEQEKAQLEANKRELEGAKSSLENEKADLEATIAANEKQIADWQATVDANKAEMEQEKAEAEKLRADYKEKTAKASQLDDALQAKIAEVLAKSNQEIEDQKEKVDAARKEADELVASGELKEDEVGQYILNKVGNGQVSSTDADLSVINSLCSQLKATITDAANILPQLAEHESNVNKCNANITAGNKAIGDLKSENTELRSKVSGLNGQISDINSEISGIDGQITGINTKIGIIDKEIAKLRGEDTTTTDPGADDVPTVPTTRAVGTGTEIPDTGAPADPVDQGGDKPYTPPTYINPFASIVFETVSYTSEVDELTASADRVDTLLTTVRAQLQANNEEYKNIFEQFAS